VPFENGKKGFQYHLEHFEVDKGWVISRLPDKLRKKLYKF